MESLILDNPVFNVKGQGKDMLLKTLELGIACVGYHKFSGFRLDDKKGIVLYWTDTEKEGYQKFMLESEPKDIVDQVFEAVSHFKLKLEKNEDEFWDLPIDDCEVGNDLGWRVYTEQWGHIDEDWQPCLAIVPSYLWIGK
ncbi:hypothetical protein CVD28_04100 [Bacillus sp. M6-12]|uniref:hypothetical protein n=1 Tax=Bacillus sp. M6-12 TaxID=2054166 RepID=UPI000C77B23D|nr:hypothetical protein [Bacillus sp. M6-12]PLS19607.1 hypothetical protein CVD28_04100 [Bacillus sp. M6-12]